MKHGTWMRWILQLTTAGFATGVRFRTRRRAVGGPRSYGLVPAMVAERLEERVFPAVLMVSSLVDSTSRDGFLTLREAVDIVNAQKQNADHSLTAAERRQITGLLGTADTIEFAPGLMQNAAATIQLSQVGGVVEGNSALVIRRTLTIRGPAGGEVILAGPGHEGDLRLFMVQSGAHLTLDNLTLSDGASDSSGGSLYIQHGATATLNHSTISYSYAHDAGGAIFNFGTLNMTGCTISDNEAHDGGAVMNYGVATLTGSTLSSNSAVDGGAFNSGRDTWAGNVTLTDCVITDNAAVDYGGGLFLDGSTVVLENCTLANNTARSGGGLANFGDLSSVTLNHSTVSGNSATSNGGGIYNAPGNQPVQVGGGDSAGIAILNNCTIADNSAFYGGGLFNLDVAFLTDCIVRGNSADHGGGIYHDARNIVLSKEHGRLTLNSTEISANTASHGGGLLNNGTAAIGMSTFSNNSATQGAAVYNDLGAAYLTASHVADNSSTEGPELFNYLGLLSVDGAVIDANPTLLASTSGNEPSGSRITGPDGTQYIVADFPEGRGIYRIFPGTSEWRVLADKVLDFRIAPNGDVYWLNDRHELYKSQAGYAGNILGTGVQSFTMDQNGTVYQISNLITPGNFALYRSLNAPLLDPVDPPVADDPFCQDPPSDAEVARAAGISSSDGVFFGPGGDFVDLDPTSPIRNVRMVKEPIVDAIDAPRFFPNIGLAQMHVCQYKCTIYYNTELNGDAIGIIYLDKNHLHQYVPEQASASAAPSQIVNRLSIAEPVITGAREVPFPEHSYDSIQSLTSSPNGTIYKLGGDYDGYHLLGQAPSPLVLWQLAPGDSWKIVSRVYQFAIAFDNTLYTLDENHALRYQFPGETDWTTLATGVRSFVRAPDETITAILENGQLLQWRSLAPQPFFLDANVSQISMAPDGTIFALINHQLKTYHLDGSSTVVEHDVLSFGMNAEGTGYVLNTRGELKTLSNGVIGTVLDTHIASFTLTGTGELYALDDRRQLKQLTSRDHWTVLHQNVKQFVVAPNAFENVYILTTRSELLRLEAGTQWYSFGRGMKSLSIDADGVVQTRNRRGQNSFFWSGALAPELDPVGGGNTPLFCMDPPSASAILWVAGLTGSNAATFTVTSEAIVDETGTPDIFNPGGPAELHHCHYKCEIHDDQGRQPDLTVFFDHDYLVRVIPAAQV